MAKLAEVLRSGRTEAAGALGAVLISPPVAFVLYAGGSLRPGVSGAAGIIVAVFLAPLLAIAGVWLDLRCEQGLGLLLLALAALFAIDGVFATYLVGLPTFLLIGLSFIAALLRSRHPPSGAEKS